MNRTVMKGKWHQTKGSIKEQWGRLTDDDVRMFLGRGEQLVGRLQERYGYTREQAEREVADFMASLHEDLPMTEEREKAAETVKRNPRIAGVFFGLFAVVAVGYLLNRIFSIVEITQETREPAS